MQQCPVEGKDSVRKYCTFNGNLTEWYWKFMCVIAIKLMKTCSIAISVAIYSFTGSMEEREKIDLL